VRRVARAARVRSSRMAAAEEGAAQEIG
jgi:hypothetical protein